MRLSNYDLESIGVYIFWSNILGLLASTMVFVISIDYLNIISEIGFDNFSIIIYVCYTGLLAIQILSIIMIKIGKKRNETIQQDDNVIKENEF